MLQKNWMLKSEDSFEKHLEFIVMEVEEREEGLYYQYMSKLGKCNVYWNPSKKEVFLEREGKEKIILKVSEGKRTEMEYQGAYCKGNFLIEGISCKGNLDFLEFSYKILEKNGNIVNNISIQMKRRIER